MKDVILNYSNCLKENVGEHGIDTQEIQSLNEKLKAAFTGVNKKKDAGKLGFMELPYKTEEANKIKQFALKSRKGFENFIAVGIGGSALGNICLLQALKHPYWNLLGSSERKGWLKLFVPDNVDPELISGVLDAVNLKKTFINVISKSGTTAECLANFFIIRDKLIKKVGKKNFTKNIIITTSKDKGFLREYATKNGINTFEIPDNVGGRFSVLSPVGLVSSAFIGIDTVKLLEGAAAMAQRCSTDDVTKNPALMYAVIQYLLYQKGKIMNVMMPYSNALYGIADWFRQLWAESLGKKTDIKGNTINVGPTPIKALGATDQHSQVQLYIEGPYDKVTTFLSVDKFRKNVNISVSKKYHYLGGHSLNELLKSEEEATRLALTQQSRPNCTVSLPEINEYTIGQVFYLFELATAYAGELFNINAFDQPGVELGKQLTYALLGRPGHEAKKAEIEQQLKLSKENSKFC